MENINNIESLVSDESSVINKLRVDNHGKMIIAIFGIILSLIVSYIGYKNVDRGCLASAFNPDSYSVKYTQFGGDYYTYSYQAMYEQVRALNSANEGIKVLSNNQYYDTFNLKLILNVIACFIMLAGLISASAFGIQITNTVSVHKEKVENKTVTLLAKCGNCDREFNVTYEIPMGKQTFNKTLQCKCPQCEELIKLTKKDIQEKL